MTGGRRFLVVAVLVLLSAAACGGSDSSDGAGDDLDAPPGSSATIDPDDPWAAVPPERLAATAAEDCPTEYVGAAPAAGENTGFDAAEQSRSFHLLLPDDGFDGPRPLFVAFTGTVQPERDFLAQSGLDQLPDDGWIVVAPVRNDNGILWPPWDAMRTPAIEDLPNADTDFFDDLVRCLAAHHEVDANRIYAGGISIGGTMTNYLLQRRSDLYAGGIAASGNFITTSPTDNPPLDDMVVIVTWGGENDVWSGCDDGQMGEELEGNCVSEISFVEDASRASQFYAAEPAVQQVACTQDLFHVWLTLGTPYMADVLLQHPKGFAGEFTLPAYAAPEGFTCDTEPFVADGVEVG